MYYFYFVVNELLLQVNQDKRDWKEWDGGGKESWKKFQVLADLVVLLIHFIFYSPYTT